MSHSCFVHSPTDGHLGCFYILVIVNNATVNLGVLMFFQISVFSSFGGISRNQLPFATVWMDLENMVSEISQLEKHEYHMISLICGI